MTHGTIASQHLYLLGLRVYSSLYFHPAKKIVEGMSMDIVRGVVETKMLGWEVEKTGRGKVIKYYPTIRLDNDNDEAGVLLEEKQQNSRIKNGFVVKYLGVKSSLARKYDYIAASRWEPCSLGGDESTDKQSPSSTSSQQRARGKRRSKPHQLDDEARLKNFLSHIKGQSQFKDEPVDLKVEELAVRKTWETVMKQQREFELKQKEEEEQRATMQVLAPVVSQDEAPMKGNLDYYEGSENEDDEDEDAIGQLASFHSSIEENVTPSLQVGDDLEFYAPEGVAGNPMWLRRAKIMGIRPNHEYPVVFNDFINLPRTHHVRKLPNGCFRAIESYQLEEQGEVTIAMCLDRTVSNLKRAREEINKAADDFWENSEQEDEESSIPVADKVKRDVALKMDISDPPVVFQEPAEQSGGGEDAPNLYEENEVGDPPSARLGGLNKNINEPATGPKRSKRQRRASQRMDL
jgi:hypothetical protein